MAQRPRVCGVSQNETKNTMETRYNDPYATTPAKTDGLTPTQRSVAWIALFAGIIALLWWMLRTPDMANPADDTRMEQNVPGDRVNTP